MSAEIIQSLDIEVGNEVKLGDGHRIVRAATGTRGTKVLELANHNVFRLNAHNQVVWQVQRVEWPGTPSWPELHALARQWKREGPFDGAYTDDGFLDPFTHMQLGDGKGQGAFAPDNIWRPGYRLHLLTRWTSYVLDPETGVATSTGDQLK